MYYTIPKVTISFETRASGALKTAFVAPCKMNNGRIRIELFRLTNAQQFKLVEAKIIRIAHSSA